MALRSTFPSRSFLIFLVIGLTIRVWNLPDPAVDAMSSRQTQTADAVRSFIEEPGFQLDAQASWRGTTGARLAQELPLYNQIVQWVFEGLDALFYETRPPRLGGADPRLIDLSGRLVSVVFWAVAFLIAQAIWRRFLNDQETFCANLLLVIAPLSAFFGQAIMPEMLLWAVSAGFVVAVLRYGEVATPARFAPVAVLGILGCLIKLPSFSPLGVLAIAWLWRKQGFSFLLKSPLHWAAAVVAVVCLKLWSGYVTLVNVKHFAEWTSERSLIMFLGDPSARLGLGLYMKVAAYVTAFVLTPAGALVALGGAWTAVRERTTDRGFFILAWLGALIFYVLVWGPQTAGGHSYYNLPMLLPCAMLFGMGANRLLAGLKRLVKPVWYRVCVGGLTVVLLVPAAVMTLYLYREDTAMLAAARYIQANVPPDKPAAVKLNHTPFAIDYMHVPAVAYYSGRQCFMLTKGTPEAEYDAALSESDVIVETLPVKADGMKAFAINLKGASRPLDKLERVQEAGFRPVEETADGLRIWKRFTQSGTQPNDTK